MTRMTVREIESAFANDYTEQDYNYDEDLRFEEAEEDCFIPYIDDSQYDWIFQDDYYPDEYDWGYIGD